MYDPAIGRFLSPDPLVQAPNNTQSYNRYSYVFNNPLSFTDPTGFYSCKSAACSIHYPPRKPSIPAGGVAILFDSAWGLFADIGKSIDAAAVFTIPLEQLLGKLLNSVVASLMLADKVEDAIDSDKNNSSDSSESSEIDSPSESASDQQSSQEANNESNGDALDSRGQDQSDNSNNNDQNDDDKDFNKQGGGKNAKHSNPDKRAAAQKKWQDAKRKLESAKRNGVPKKDKQKIQKEVDHWKRKMDSTGENHSMKPKGNR